MIYWNRFISYIYRYHRNEKCENAGFIKFQKAGNKARINIGMKDMMFKGEMTYDVYLYLETLEYGSENEMTSNEQQITIPAMIQIGKMRMKNGRSEGFFEIDWNNVKNSEKPVTAWNGIIIYGKGQGDMFCSSWTDNIVNYEKAYMWSKVQYEPQNNVINTENYGEIQQSEKQKYREYDRDDQDIMLPEQEQAEIKQTEQHQLEQYQAQQNRSEQERLELKQAKRTEDAIKIAEQISEVEQSVSDTDALSRIMNTHEKLPALFVGAEDGGMIECVKITPNDIGLTDMANWHLGVNSFLTHGFYNYKYLLFGRLALPEDEGHPAYLIGIPGVYTSKEKYLANMFGFDRFCPVENNNKYRTGRFGYWITGLK